MHRHSVSQSSRIRVAFPPHVSLCIPHPVTRSVVYVEMNLRRWDYAGSTAAGYSIFCSSSNHRWRIDSFVAGKPYCNGNFSCIVDKNGTVARAVEAPMQVFSLSLFVLRFPMFTILLLCCSGVSTFRMYYFQSPSFCGVQSHPEILFPSGPEHHMAKLLIY